MELTPTQKIKKGVQKGYKLHRKKGGKGKGLTQNEIALADLVAGGMTGKDAAFKVYNPSNSNSAAAIASEVLAKPDVRAYLESVAMKAAGKMTQLMDSAKSEMVQYVAAKDILDRTGYKIPEPAKDPNQGATYNFIFSKETQESVAQIEATIRARLTGTYVQENTTTMEFDAEGPKTT